MLLETKNLCYSYYKKPLCLRDVSLGLKSGQRAVVFGVSDAGKTTLLKVVSGFDTTYFGSVLLNGKQIKDIADSEKNVSLLFSEPVLLKSKTIKQNLDFACEVSGKINITDAEKTKRLADFFVEKNINEKVKKLSLFEKRAVSIVRSLLKNPKIIFLDDQFEGLSDDETTKMQQIYKSLFDDKSLTILCAIGNESYQKNKEFFDSQNFDRVYFLSMANLSEFNSTSQMLDSKPTIDSLAFVGDYQVFDGFVGLKNGEFYFVLSDEKFFKLDKKYDKTLKKYDIQNKGEEDARLAVFDNLDLLTISDSDFNKSLAGGGMVIYSLLDGKRMF